jgi:hypothetical protein
MNYIFYTNQGQIKSMISCSEDLFQHQIIPEGCSTLEVEIPPINILEYYVDNGQVVEMPKKPDDYSIFDYSTKQWVQNQNLGAYKVRMQRDDLLAQSDWTDVASAPARFGPTLYQQWQTYRQSLRDVPNQSGFPFNVIWPIAPTN